VRRQRGHDFLAPGGDGQVFGEVDAQGGGVMGGVHRGDYPSVGREPTFNPDFRGSLGLATRRGNGRRDITRLGKEHSKLKFKEFLVEY